MPDHEYRWRDERYADRDGRNYRRSEQDRDLHRQSVLDEDDYGMGYGEEGMTNYRLLRRRGSYSGNDRLAGSSSSSSYGGHYNQRDRGMMRDRMAGYGDYGASGEYGSSRSRFEGRSGRGRLDYDPNDRGWMDRASDEVSSWFGDEDAQARRELDAKFEGRGPKGYRRSDARISEDLSDRLTDDPYIDASDIEISVENAEVTLSGTVDSRQARRRCEDIAERISGVTHVQNNLRVSSGSETVREERESSTKSGLFGRS